MEHNNLEMKNEPSLVERYGSDYFKNRYGNNEQRLLQFQIDASFLKKFKSSGVICDVGCSTGEFLTSIFWEGDLYGMEINLEAKLTAEENGYCFDKNIYTESNFFDVVVFRGTIQHVDEPFRMMKAAYQSLKKGGVIVFLATPNTDSILYRIKLDLPFLDKNLNFYLPGKNNLSNSLKNYGFNILSVEYPYWDTPYRNFPKDVFLFFLNVLSRRFYKHAFWRNSFSLIAQK